MKRALLLLPALLAGLAATAQNVSLQLSGLRSGKGAICISVFRDNKSFMEDRPSTRLKFPKTAVKNGALNVSLALGPGVWGIALLDDENDNGKMDNSMIGLPKEGFGFSNFFLSGMSRPTFSDFSFEVKAAPLTLNSRIRYL